MFKDKDQELRRLEDALWEQEEADLPEAPEEYGPAEAGDYYAYNADQADVDLDSYSEEVWQAPKPRFTGLITLACILSAAILLILLYLFLRFGGYL